MALPRHMMMVTKGLGGILRAEEIQNISWQTSPAQGHRMPSVWRVQKAGGKERGWVVARILKSNTLPLTRAKNLLQRFCRCNRNDISSKLLPFQFWGPGHFVSWFASCAHHKTEKKESLISGNGLLLLLMASFWLCRQSYATGFWLVYCRFQL